MKISRRSFFLNSGAAALTAAIVFPVQNVFGQTQKSAELFPIPPESVNDALTFLKREHFEPFINTLFQFQPETGRVFNLKLIAAENLSRGENETQGFVGESFSLLFEGTKKSKISQGTFQITHALGQFSLLIVPVGLTGNRYEAIINRINV
jgi:hypothetical protein